jgi:hypothetical protein
MTTNEQIELAAVGVRQTEDHLIAAAQAETARLVRKTFEVLLPALIDSSPISPPHHPTTMLPLMLEVATSEGLSAAETQALLLALLCHDAYLGTAERILSFLPPLEGLRGKIRVSAIRQTTGERQRLLVERGILERTLHNEEAARQIPSVLAAAGALSGVTVAPRVGEMARALVNRHDLPTIAELKVAGGERIGPSDLFGPGERLELLFRSIDRLWMETPEGIRVDGERDLAEGAWEVDPAALRMKAKSNARRHYEEYDLYAQVYKDEVRRFGFIENSLYTSKMAFRMFRQFVEASE